ncbi:MAG: GAF domain-containing protein [Chloroflexota bacterium]|nr:GAF domain-containing protein [Chloroflexota bacterium]
METQKKNNELPRENELESERSRQEAISRLQMINAVTTKLTQSFNLEQTLDDILDKVLEVMGTETGAVYLLGEEEQGLMLVAHRNLPDEVVEEENGLKSARMLARHEALQCKLAGPLRSKGRVNGLLFVGSRRACPILRQEEELLNTICNTTGVFVENVHLYQERERQSQVERCVCEVTEEITSELELDKVLPKVMQIAVKLTEAEGGIVALLNEERNIITYPYLHHLPSELADVTVSTGEGLSGEVMTTGCPTVIDNYQTYPRAIPAFVRAGLTSVMIVPIVSGERTFGALSILSIKEARGFSDRDVAVLTAIGRQAGIAIENAYLYENMRFYARRITQAQENERRRIARELHDDTIQSLVALSRRLEALAISNGPLPETAAQYIGELQEAIGNVIKRVRRFSRDLRPSILDNLGLLPALEELTAELGRQSSFQAEFRVVGEERRLSSDVELTLFRIAQEALNNVRKHAQATEVVTTVELSNGAIKMIIQDNGKGFKPPKLTEHPTAAGKLGLTGMHERARLLGGVLEVNSEPGRGAKVIVNVPI